MTVIRWVKETSASTIPRKAKSGSRSKSSSRTIMDNRKRSFWISTTKNRTRIKSEKPVTAPDRSNNSFFVLNQSKAPAREDRRFPFSVFQIDHNSFDAQPEGNPIAAKSTVGYSTHNAFKFEVKRLFGFIEIKIYLIMANL